MIQPFRPVRPLSSQPPFRGAEPPRWAQLTRYGLPPGSTWRSAGRLALDHGPLDHVEDVAHRLLLPFRQLLPRRDRGHVRLREVPVDLGDPADDDELPALRPGQPVG